jgi:D-tyrosyl-tRNA(Tyr) deacylase
MRALLQRVKGAKVIINHSLYSSIGSGLLVFLGIESEDTLEDLRWLVKKICQLRIFSDEQKQMNLSIQEISGEVMVVSQFTLFASTKKGNRPGFNKAAEPKEANTFYKAFVEEINKQLNQEIKTGQFAADMDIELINDGPVTIFIDTKNKE